MLGIIKSVKNGKTPGHDKITVEMMKCTGPIATEYLLWILNQAWREKLYHESEEQEWCYQYTNKKLIKIAVITEV